MNTETGDSDRARKFMKLSYPSIDKEDDINGKTKYCKDSDNSNNTTRNPGKFDKCDISGGSRGKSERETLPGEKHEKNEREISDEKCETSLRFESLTTYKVKTSDSKPWISSIQILPNGKIIMADFNNLKLYIYNQYQEIQSVINTPGKPCCISVIQSDRVAVTLQDKKIIALVNTASCKVVKHLYPRDCCHGITFSNDKLVVNCLENGLSFMDLSGTIHHTIPDVTGEAYLCASESGNIFCSLYWSHKIVCFNQDGDQLYSFSNLTLKCPRGISSDNNGQVFTCEFAKNKIHVINSEGTKSSVVLSKKHGINNPLCVTYDNSDCKLYVSNNDGESVTVFKRALL